jgi:hypothetical protein
MVIVIVPELDGAACSVVGGFRGVDIPADPPGSEVTETVIVMVAELDDGGFWGVDIPTDPAESAVPQSKISAKSEAKHRKRSAFMVQSLPQIPLDNHNPHIIQFPDDFPRAEFRPQNS